MLIFSYVLKMFFFFSKSEKKRLGKSPKNRVGRVTRKKFSANMYIIYFILALRDCHNFFSSYKKRRSCMHVCFLFFAVIKRWTARREELFLSLMQGAIFSAHRTGVQCSARGCEVATGSINQNDIQCREYSLHARNTHSAH